MFLAFFLVVGMFKYLVALVALVVAASGQTVDPLPYQQILDPNFVLSWDYDAENITMEFLFNSNGWGCLYLLSDDGTFLDVIWGGFDEDYGVPYLDVPCPLSLPRPVFFVKRMDFVRCRTVTPSCRVCRPDRASRTRSRA